MGASFKRPRPGEGHGRPSLHALLNVGLAILLFTVTLYRHCNVSVSGRDLIWARFNGGAGSRRHAAEAPPSGRRPGGRVR